MRKGKDLSQLLSVLDERRENTQRSFASTSGMKLLFVPGEEENQPGSWGLRFFTNSAQFFLIVSWAMCQRIAKFAGITVPDNLKGSSTRLQCRFADLVTAALEENTRCVEITAYNPFWDSPRLIGFEKAEEGKTEIYRAGDFLTRMLHELGLGGFKYKQAWVDDEYMYLMFADSRTPNDSGLYVLYNEVKGTAEFNTYTCGGLASYSVPQWWYVPVSKDWVAPKQLHASNLSIKLDEFVKEWDKPNYFGNKITVEQFEYVLNRYSPFDQSTIKALVKRFKRRDVQSVLSAIDTVTSYNHQLNTFPISGSMDLCRLAGSMLRGTDKMWYTPEWRQEHGTKETPKQSKKRSKGPKATGAGVVGDGTGSPEATGSEGGHAKADAPVDGKGKRKAKHKSPSESGVRPIESGPVEPPPRSH